MYLIKKNEEALRHGDLGLLQVAEDTGFEPAEAFASTVFKTAALNRSANPPHFFTCVR